MKLLKSFTLPSHIFFILFFFSINLALSQNLKKENKNLTTPALMSAVVPGLGQIKNKKLWKVPVIYSAIGTCTYFFVKNNNDFNKYSSEYFRRKNDENNVSTQFINLSDNNLLTLRDYHRKNRDLNGILIVAFYILNVIDASVDNHLKEYNLNDNLSLNLDFENYSELNKLINLELKYNF
tara:strand:- start:824 stop:1363 length:540 start_codon:yes stop_codon:yes gene_type:complete